MIDWNESAKLNDCTVEWHQLSPIADNDRIIDTIDYATDELSFKKFDELVLDAIKETKVNKS